MKTATNRGSLPVAQLSPSWVVTQGPAWIPPGGLRSSELRAGDVKISFPTTEVVKSRT